jgi:LSD1 subclass zinc finger protein
MTVRFACSGCGKMMQAPETAAGKRARCPLCQTVQIVPPPEPSVSEDDSIFPEVPHGAPVDSGVPSDLPAAPPAFISPPPPPPAPPAQLATDCLKAITYGASNFKSILILVLYAAALAFFLGFLRIFLWPLIFAGPAGTVILASVGGAAGFIIWGFYFRFFLDAIISSLEGVD